MTLVKYNTTEAGCLKMLYREAGSSAAPKRLLLHGFPSASHMFRDLLPRVADEAGK